jgi:hypothetical protein
MGCVCVVMVWVVIVCVEGLYCISMEEVWIVLKRYGCVRVVNV